MLRHKWGWGFDTKYLELIDTTGRSLGIMNKSATYYNYLHLSCVHTQSTARAESEVWEIARGEDGVVALREGTSEISHYTISL